MADSQRLDALLEQVVEWQSLGVTLDADGQMWPRVATATSTATTSTPRAGRKRARAPASPRQPGKRRAQSSMHHWQAEAVKLWETRAEAIATANAGSDKRMASWQKRKVELQSLREEARQLEEQLRTIRDGSAPSSAEGKHRRERQRQYVEIAWQLAAERAQEQKEAAIAENARLKSLVGKHLELSRALQPALFQDSSADLPRQARLQSTVERTALFASMEQKLTASLPNVKAVIQRTLGAASARARPVDGQHTRVVGVNTAHPVGSIQRSRAFPFRDDDVMDAMWNCAQRGFPDVAERTHWVRMGISHIGLYERHSNSVVWCLCLRVGNSGRGAICRCPGARHHRGHPAPNLRGRPRESPPPRSPEALGDICWLDRPVRRHDRVADGLDDHCGIDGRILVERHSRVGRQFSKLPHPEIG